MTATAPSAPTTGRDRPARQLRPSGRRDRGHRRWARRRVGALTATTLAAALVTGPFLVVHYGRAGDPDVGGYPQRIGFDRPSDRLPERPGPLAGTIYDNDFGSGRHLGVTATGHLWELPEGTSALSPSGSRLLTEPYRGRGRLVVRDLSTGDRWVLDRTWAQQLHDDDHLAWSPDETAVLGDFAPRRRSAPHRSAVLELATGAVTAVGPGYPAGFRSATEPVTVREVPGPGAATRMAVTTTDLVSGSRTRRWLQLADQWRGDRGSGLVASIAPDGRTLLLVENDSDTSYTRVRLFSLADGAELAPHSVRDWDGCPPTWRDQDPVLPTTVQPGGPGAARSAGARQLGSDGSTLLVAIHPRLQATCLQLTPEALAAGPRWALFGTATATWTWYWFPGLVVVTMVLLGLALLYRSLRRAWSRLV